MVEIRKRLSNVFTCERIGSESGFLKKREKLSIPKMYSEKVETYSERCDTVLEPR